MQCRRGLAEFLCVCERVFEELTNTQRSEAMVDLSRAGQQARGDCCFCNSRAQAVRARLRRSQRSSGLPRGQGTVLHYFKFLPILLYALHREISSRLLPGSPTVLGLGFRSRRRDPRRLDFEVAHGVGRQRFPEEKLQPTSQDPQRTCC